MSIGLESVVLSQDDIAQWCERGYHFHHGVFTADEVAAIREGCEDVLQGKYETGIAPDDIYWKPGDNPLAMHKIDNAWKANRTIAQAVTNPRMGQIAAQLIGAPSMRLWQDQISYKPASGGKVVTYHQDWAYWQMIAQCETVTCWIALDDVLPESGPMVYLEGSQKLGIYKHPMA
jgi:ectoine hydroxylase-related dioxygenase (phytanoyl-CoA dioxygenase family)